MWNIAKTAALVSMMAFVLGASGFGQIITSSIVGRVTDTSGAAIPLAEITITNEGTGIAVHGTTSSAGTYSVPGLLAGVYDVSAAKQGFATYKETGVRLESLQVIRVALTLQVGTTHQSVTVSGAAPLVHTETQTIGTTLTARQISDLPFGLQAVDSLMQLAAGWQGPEASNPQIGGGTHWGSTNFSLNGVSVNDPGNGGGNGSTSLGLVTYPSIDTLQEFKVEATNTNAEYRMIGTVTMVTKGGTNQFHGQAFEYMQNDALNTNDWGLNLAGLPKSPYRLNQFGGNIGGPIRKDKGFFFFDFDGLRQREYSVVTQNFPSTAMRSGDFSALCTTFASGICAKGTQLYNPFSGQPFPNDQIPSTLITAQAQALLKFLPAPTLSTSSGLPLEAPNYTAAVPVARDFDDYTVRLDYNVSSSDKLFGVFNHNTGLPWNVFEGHPPGYGNYSNSGFKDQVWSITETHIFGPTMLNEFRAALFYPGAIRSGQNLNFDPRSIFPQLTTSPNRGLPTINMTGYSNITDLGKGAYGYAPDIGITDNFTHVYGRHTLKAGADLTAYKEYNPSPNAPLGTFSFSGTWTGNSGWPGALHSIGNSFADFLLGTANSSVTGAAAAFTAVDRSNDLEFYAQDSWQASPRLTLYYGLRYMYESPWTYRDHLATYFDIQNNILALPQNSLTPTLPAVGASAAQFAAYPFTTTKALGLPLNYNEGDKNNWGPRFGFAFRPFSGTQTVLRGGYGVYYNFQPAFIGSRDDVLNPPWLNGLGGYAAQTYSSNLPGKPATPFLPDITFQNPFPSTNSVVAGVAPHPTIFSFQRDFKNAVAQQWDFSVEHQFGLNWMTRVSYIGSQTHHLPWFFADINMPATETPDVPVQSQRPLQPWGVIDATRSGAKSNFNQLQFELIKRFANGFSAQAEYQFTSCLDNAEYIGGLQNWHFPDQDYGYCSFERRHRLIFNYIYALPVGRGRKWLGNGARAVDALLGGWEVSGISTYETGEAFSVVNEEIPGTFVGWTSGRADRLPGSLYAGQGNQVVAFGQNGVQWFNPAVFTTPQPWTMGNSARNSVFNPGFWNWDIGAMKTFAMTEHTRLQFRAEFLNAFNHPNLNSVTADGDQFVPDTRDGAPPDPTAGVIFDRFGSRTIQLGLKLMF